MDANTEKPLTLLDHIEQILDLAKDSKLSGEFWTKVEPHTSAIAKRMDITETQAMILAICVNGCDDKYQIVEYLARYLGCEKIEIIKMMGEIDSLEKRKFLKRERGKMSLYYHLPREVLDAVRDDSPFAPERIDNLSADKFFNVIASLFADREVDQISFITLHEDLKALIEANPQLPLTKLFGRGKYSDVNSVLLAYFFNNLVSNDTDSVKMYDLQFIFSQKNGLGILKRELRRADNALIRDGLIAPGNNSGMMDTERFSLTAKAKEHLEGMDVLFSEDKKLKNVIRHNTIVAKELFYKDPTRRQVEQLGSLLEHGNYLSVRERLATSGMRAGFACLFHGGPGTGKTETAYQLARRTGRDIMVVDIAQTKSMWLGESEKLIKEVFDRYRALVRKSRTTPILLFNEADAVIGRRQEVFSGSISQTENTIQNIILQEMESLEGIMIATTNLVQNLDKAFERRFLYKIAFDRPTVEAKTAIWRTMLPALDLGSIDALAREYDLSGGQIENVARKCTVEHIITGEQPSLPTLQEFCRGESLNARRRIGY